MRGLESRNQAFNRQRHHNDKKEPRKETPHTGRATDVSVAYDLFFDNGLCNLQRHHCRCQQTDCFDNLLRGTAIQRAYKSHHAELGGDDDEHACGTGK